MHLDVEWFELWIVLEQLISALSLFIFELFRCFT